MRTTSSITIFFLIILLIIAISYNHGFVSALQHYQKTAVSKRIFLYAENFEKKETSCSEIFYTAADEKYIALIAQTLDTYFPLLADDFESEAEKATLILYPSETLLEKSIGIDYDITPMGVYYGGILNILSPHLWLYGDETKIKSSFLEDGPIIHELAHYFLDTKANGNYPIWFSEGVALYYEKKYTNFEWHPELKEAAKNISIEQLLEFKAVDESLAYRRAFDIINDYVNNYGEESLQKIISDL